mgnify:FL=1
MTETLKSLGLVAEAQGRLHEAIDDLGKARENYLRETGLSTDDPSPDYARVLRKAGRIAEAEKVEASPRTPGAK